MACRTTPTDTGDYRGRRRWIRFEVNDRAIVLTPDRLPHKVGRPSRCTRPLRTTPGPLFSRSPDLYDRRIDPDRASDSRNSRRDIAHRGTRVPEQSHRDERHSRSNQPDSRLAPALTATPLAPQPCDAAALPPRLAWDDSQARTPTRIAISAAQRDMVQKPSPFASSDKPINPWKPNSVLNALV